MSVNILHAFATCMNKDIITMCRLFLNQSLHIILGVHVDCNILEEGIGLLKNVRQRDTASFCLFFLFLFFVISSCFFSVLRKSRDLVIYCHTQKHFR